MIFALHTPADTATLTLDRLEQVSAFSGQSLIASGIVTGLRELTVEFRYKNPATYTAWATLDNLAIAAVTPNANQPFYLETRYTRTGMDTTGSIDILRHDFSYTIDPNASTAAGCFVNTSLYSDVVDFLKGFLASDVVQVRGGNGFSVEFSKPNACRIDGRPKIYFHRVHLHERETDAIGCAYRQRVTARIGTKGQCGRDEQKILDQTSRMLEAFNPYIAAKNTFDITFKGDARTAITMNALGIFDPSTSNMIELEDDCDCISNEFEISFFIQFPIENQ